MFDSTTPLLEMRDISMHFGATKALNGVDFACKAGEVHAVLGSNVSSLKSRVAAIAGSTRWT
ncbi:MAG: sugar ABC transporter ATP-binding protein, partial [Pseudomonadota bacterium]